MDSVHVHLSRAYWWVHGDEGPGRYTVYGPGEVAVPRVMAEGLVAAGVLEADALGEEAGAGAELVVEPENGPVTEVEAAPGEAQQIHEMTVDEVLAAVEAGELDASYALQAEQAGRARKTLLEGLEKLAGLLGRG